ncbi:MAG: MotA/TolQ/ExbB proton channel family protein, partial [Alphaproteobacteria bacterium]
MADNEDEFEEGAPTLEPSPSGAESDGADMPDGGVENVEPESMGLGGADDDADPEGELLEPNEQNEPMRNAKDLEAVYDIPVQLSAVLGKASMQVSQLLKLGRGAVVELDRKVSNPTALTRISGTMARTQASEGVQLDPDSRIDYLRVRFDLATVLGLVSGFGLLFGALTLGGSPGAFIDAPSFLIVIGGTVGITTICFSLPEIARTPMLIARAVIQTSPDAKYATYRMLRLAEIARKEGLLELDSILVDLDEEPFVRQALSMAVDGVPANEITAVLERDVDEMMRRHINAAGILRKAADVAPAMGLIGTLIGLVQMLGNLEDPSSIGPSMAIALLTTFYGAVLATMVFSPLAAKLERNSAVEALVANIYMLTAQSICRKENPRRLEVMLNSML